MRLPIRRFFLAVAAVAAFIASQSGSLVFAETFNNESGSFDFNDAMAWENDSHPGLSSGQARIGEVGISGTDMVPFANPVTVSLGANSLGAVNGLRVGQGGSGDGTFNHTAGTLGTSDWSFIGVDGTDAVPSIGRYNLSGTASFGSSGNTNLHLGLGGGAHPNNPNEGYVTVADQASILANAVVVGSNDDNEGFLTQTGGTVTSDNWVNVGQETGARGVYNLSGGTLNTKEMSVGQEGGATGDFNVSGTAIVNVTGDAPTNDLGLRIGRRNNGDGAMTIVGHEATINTTGFSVAADDGPFVDSESTLTYVSSSDGVSPIVASAGVNLNDGSGLGFADLFVDLVTMAPPAGDVLLIDVGGALSGSFRNAPEGSLVPNSGGRFITYTYGDGNDIALVVPEPAGILLIGLGLVAFASRRRKR